MHAVELLRKSGVMEVVDVSVVRKGRHNGITFTFVGLENRNQATKIFAAGF